MTTSSMKKLIFFNPEPDGTSRTIKANYFKVSPANLFRVGSFGATDVVEIEDV